jgi:hypothetical protein
MRTPVYIVDTFSDIVLSVNSVLSKQLGTTIQYQYGSSLQILDKLVQLNNGITKGNRFPLISLFQPFEEERGKDGFYAHITIKKLIIATLTGPAIGVEKRYINNFKPTLYPIYYELLNQIVLNGNFAIDDPDMIPHTKVDNPDSIPPKGSQFQEHVDSIDLFNIKLTYNLNT